MRYTIYIICIVLMINEKSFSQWEPIQDFHANCNKAVLSNDSMIWGIGNLGQVFKHDIDNQEFEYYQFSDNLEFHCVDILNDSVMILGGRYGQNIDGFLLSYRYDIDSIETIDIKPYIIWDVKFISQDTGFHSCFNGIHRTTNGGTSWNTVWKVDSIGAEFGDIYSITFDSTRGIYASGEKRQSLDGSSFQGFVIRSEDCGSTWELVFENPYGNIWGLEYRHGTVYCYDKNRTTIYSSQDSGATWNTYNIPISDETLTTSDVTFLSRDHLIACIAHEYGFLTDETNNQRYMLLDSPDNGRTWYVQHEIHSPYSPDVTSLKTIVNVDDTLLFCYGINLALRTDNQGGDNNPLLDIIRLPVILNVRVFPIPASDHLFVEGLSNLTHYAIYTLSGQRIDSNQINNEENIVIPLTAIKSGAYIINFYKNNFNIYSQLIFKQ